MSKFRWLFAIAIAVASIPGLLQAQGNNGSIRGTVVDANSQRPIAGAQVFIPATQGAVAGSRLGAVTDAQGRYLIDKVPSGRHTVRAEYVGYGADQREVEVAAGQAVTHNFRLQSSAIQIEEIVVTGVAGATTRAKLPFEVSKVNASELPVPAVSPQAMLQGKVPGLRVVQGSGQPGQGASIMLRGATSINASGRNQEPLYIVDGVILGSRPNDLDPNDIESIEVVKGAAAASLYGSRAGSGVIQIRTKRGQTVSNETRYTFRTEAGTSELAKQIPLAQMHTFRMDPSGTTFVDARDNPVDYSRAIPQTSNPSRLFQDKPYPGQTFNQFDRFFNPGDFLQTYVSAEGQTGNTNYYTSFSNLNETGIVRFNEGYNRQNFRLNLDHGLREDLQLSVSTLYSTSWQDLLDDGGGAGAFFALTFVRPNIDLLEQDESGDIRVAHDPRSLESNPLYEIKNSTLERERRRFMGSALVRWAPVTYFDLEGNFSYDRADQQTFQMFPKGYARNRGHLEPDSRTAGQLSRYTNDNEAINGSATASLYRNFGDLTTKTRVRYLYEAAANQGFSSQGTQLAAAGITTLGAAAGDRLVGSYDQDVRSEGYFLTSSLDYAGKYILDGLVRRDGSSLFGSDARWQTYYRASGAWRVSEEPWFQLPNLDNFKLRASYGTAGGRPRFEAQYETYSVVQGRLRPLTLGNSELKPEFSRELEVGVDAGLFQRLLLTVNYANTVTQDQILRVPLPGFAGFQFQWRNAGTLASDTWEASLESNLVQTRDFNWGAKLLFDRTSTVIRELNVPAYQAGSSNAFMIRAGEKFGTFYGHKFARSCSELPAGAQQHCNQFQVNDDGYLVFTGGKPFTAGVGPDGKAGTNDDLWGTSCSAPVSASGVRSSVGCQFGMPVYAQCTDDSGNPTLDCALGNTQPDFNMSFSSNMDWKGLSLYGLLDASRGFNVYNQTIQWAYREERAGEVDQNKSEELKKPVGYYHALYDINNVNSHFTEDGSFVKLRELSLRYSLPKSLRQRVGLGRTDRTSLALIGRNLLTWTNYKGYDPEVGNPFSELGSATIDRFDGYQYPNFRTLTASVEITF